MWVWWGVVPLSADDTYRDCGEWKKTWWMIYVSVVRCGSSQYRWHLQGLWWVEEDLVNDLCECGEVWCLSVQMTPPGTVVSGRRPGEWSMWVWWGVVPLRADDTYRDCDEWKKTWWMIYISVVRCCAYMVLGEWKKTWWMIYVSVVRCGSSQYRWHLQGLWWVEEDLVNDLCECGEVWCLSGQMTPPGTVVSGRRPGEWSISVWWGVVPLRADDTYRDCGEWKKTWWKIYVSVVRCGASQYRWHLQLLWWVEEDLVNDLCACGEVLCLHGLGWVEEDLVNDLCECGEVWCLSVQMTPTGTVMSGRRPGEWSMWLWWGVVPTWSWVSGRGPGEVYSICDCFYINHFDTLSRSWMLQNHLVLMYCFTNGYQISPIRLT